MQNVDAPQTEFLPGIQLLSVSQSGSQALLEKERPPPGKFTETAVLKHWVDISKKNWGQNRMSQKKKSLLNVVIKIYYYNDSKTMINNKIHDKYI